MIFLFQLADVDVRFYGRGGMRASAYDQTRRTEMLIFRRHSVLVVLGGNDISTSIVDRVVYVRLIGGATAISVQGPCSDLEAQQRIPQSNKQTFGGDWAGTASRESVTFEIRIFQA